MEKYCRARQVTGGNIIWRMRIARRIQKATNPLSEYVIFIVFPQQHLLHERPSLLRYRYIACLVTFFHKWQLCISIPFNVIVSELGRKREGVKMIKR